MREAPSRLREPMKLVRILPAVLALTLMPAGVFAEGERAAPTLPLPALPTPASIALPSPDAASQAELDAWLKRLTDENPATRREAVREIESASRAMVPAIAAKIAEIRKSARLGGMAVVLTQARKNAQTGSTDSFDRVMAAPRPNDAAWRDLASLLGMSRKLARIGTTPAVRELVALYPTFDELLRVDVQQQLAKLGDKAIAPLIEARRGQTRQVRIWAGRQLEALGRGTPGEAVQAEDPQVLPDILRAYGRIRDSDAARVVVSFANSDRTQVREAAREAVVLLAENALWPLREGYEALVGTRASDDWGWERTARELFAAYDRARLADVYAQLEEGLAARAENRLGEMAAAFDAVLARAPKLDRRGEMVEGYYEYARSVVGKDPVNALAYLRRALRIDPTGPLASRIGAEVAFLEAEALAARGLVEISAYERALELDPSHARARAAVERLSADGRGRDAMLRRYAGFGGLAVAAVLGGAALLLRRRRGLIRELPVSRRP